MRWIWVIFFLLFAGASVDITSALVGAFSFHVSTLPSDDTWWDGGSALSSHCWCWCLGHPFPWWCFGVFCERFSFDWGLGFRFRTFLLVAGASVFNSSASGGALTLTMDALPSGAWWNIGSAYIYQ